MAERVDDAELVRRAELGEKDAFNQLIERHYGVVVSAAFAILANMDASKDCAQEAFLEAAGSLARLRERSKFCQWIYGISRRKAIYLVRRQRLHTAALRVKTDESKRMVRLASPAEQAGKAEKLESIRRALAEISPLYREALTLKYIDGRSHEDIARVLDISLAAVDKRLMRGKDLLRESLRRWSSEA
jgi:RNA polymerase sigma-70 factor, ECF subfamily